MLVHTNELTLISLLPFSLIMLIQFHSVTAYSRVSAWENVKDPFTASKSEQCVLSFVKINSQIKEKILQY